jgi:signal transduction histidine kinase
MIIRGLILCAILWALPSLATDTARSAWDNVPTVNLTDVLEHAHELPFLAQHVQGWNIHPHYLGQQAGRAALITDLDGDGTPELLRSAPDYYHGSVILPRGNPSVTGQVNFPREYGEGARQVGRNIGGKALSGPFQLDDDDQLEILAVGTTLDRRSWGFWTSEFSMKDGRLRLREDRVFFLDHFKERRPDDLWDGFMAVTDTLNGLLQDPERSALVVTIRSGFDVYGRGVMLVDPLEGKILWHFEVGNGPSGLATQVVDLDGDQAREIIFMGTSSCNLDEEKVGGYSDDHTRLYIVDRQGKEKWSRRLCGETSGGWFQVDDFDDTPGLEIMSYGAAAGTDTTHFFIWSSQGELMGQEDFPESLHSAAWLPGDSTSPPSLVFTTFNRHLYKAQVLGSQLKPVLKAQLPEYGKLFHLPPGKSGDSRRLGILMSNREFLILDSELSPLLALPDENRIFGQWVEILQAHDHEILLTNSRSHEEGWEIIPNPNALPTHPVLRALARTPLWAWLLIAVTLLALAGWVLAASKHRAERRRRTFIPVDSDHMREARLHLLEDLELSGHGAIAPLRSLRRLLWLLDALQVGFGMNEGLRSRFGEILTDCHQDDLPRLLVILERAQAAGIQSPQVSTATEALQNIQAQLARMREQDLETSSLQELSINLHRHSEVAETALQSLRHDVADEFQTNLHQVVDKVLRANAQDIERQGIKVQVGQLAQAAGGDSADPEGTFLCRMDPFEMEFILDNLVGNAIRAMDSADTRQLKLTWQSTSGMVKMQIKDTGLGIAVEDRDSIMETDFSTKERGGMGLPKSMRLLRKYGGKLSIAESSPGQGTTFQLLLPRAK